MDGNQSAVKHIASLHAILQSYEKQLLGARQLARFRARKLMEAGLGIDEPEPGQNSQKTVDGVVRELSLSLLISGNPFPVVEEIRKELSRQLQKEIEFTYPPGQRLRLLAREGDKLRPLTEEEQRFADKALEGITRSKVDESMQYRPLRKKSV